MLATPKDLEDSVQERRAAAPYFGLGFQKVTLDPAIFKKILAHFSSHKDSFFIEHDIAFLQTQQRNYSPALMVHDSTFNQNLCTELKPLHEQWSGMELSEAKCYGIRVYQPGCFLYNHIDKTETHLISSTICVGHRLHSPWPLYIEDIDGQPHHISMKPGEMVLYEGAKLLHGRPYPLDGRFYAGLFVHYTPVHLLQEVPAPS